jgi:hypothetical protein
VPNIDKMKTRLRINGALIYALSLLWIFGIVYQTGDKARVVYVMNAFLFGGMVSLFIMYSRYICYVLSEPSEWNRARQFIASTGVLWAAMFAMTAASIWRNSTTSYNIVNTNFLDILTKYLAIIASQMQIFAPTHGEKMTFGDERKTMIYASIVGAVVALAAMVMQTEDLLTW